MPELASSPIRQPETISQDIEYGLAHTLPMVQAALDEAFAMIETNGLEHSTLGREMLGALNKAQEQLCQSAESAMMVNNHLGSSVRDSHRYARIMSDAQALLHKGFQRGMEGIRAALACIEHYEAEMPATPLPDEGLHLPRWLMHLLTDNETDHNTAHSIPREVLCQVKEGLGRIHSTLTLTIS